MVTLCLCLFLTIGSMTAHSHEFCRQDTVFVQPDSSIIVEADTILVAQDSTTVDTVLVIQTTPLPIVDEEVFFPMGEVSFADSVQQYDPGALGKDTGDEPDERFQNPFMAMGPPDFKAGSGSDTGFVSLGRGGFIVLKFLDNVLIDGPGPDLHIAEVKSPAEDVMVWISEDGRIFLPVGRATHDAPNVDISAVARRGSIYPYVKVRDVPNQAGDVNTSLGADIDAVGAINTAMRIILPVDQLFRPRTIRFTEGAQALLNDVAIEIRNISNAIVFIEVHTDGHGAQDFNFMLSQSQAGEIRNYFLDEAGLTAVTYSALGIGEKRPVASNETDAGRIANRRVEIFIQTDNR